MRSHALAALSLSAGLCCQAAARETVHAIGRGGWELERFGAEATILRTRPSGSGTEEAALLLSCAGADRRLRLTLPGMIGAEPGLATGGLLLMRAGGAASVARVAVQGATLTLTGRQVPGAVLAELRASAQGARGLDLLLHVGSGPVVLGRLTAFHLSLSSAPGDGLAFRDASAACGTDAPAAAGSAAPRR